MYFTTVAISTGLTLALAPVGAFAWAKAADGVWVANNVVYPQVGSYKNVHESCTRMNSNIVLTSGGCAYWVNGNGVIARGYCKSHSNGVSCSPGCPNNLSPCQYIEDDGSCSYGYIACLQKMGCGGKAGDADCIGTSVGCLVCNK